VLACSFLLLAGTASAHKAHHKRAHVAALGAPTCEVRSLPSFIAQGEFTTAATVADVVEVECNPNIYGTGSKIKITASQLFTRCKGRLTWYVPNPYSETGGKGVSLELDAAGNATVALIAGPGCSPGESLITAHMEEEPFETVTTSFAVLPPVTTPQGVTALPSAQVEDDFSSAVATVLQLEFTGGSEKEVRVGSEELYHRCRIAPHIRWITIDRRVIAGVSEIEHVQLDNDGNSFVLVIGGESCAEGPSLIEADLESKPFTTVTTNFTIEAPRRTF
jgi:hypothetical protein